MSLWTAFGAAQIRRVHAAHRAGRVLLGVAACIGAVQFGAHTAQLTPSEVKAGFIINLAKFVEWPEAAFASGGEPITFGIVGSDPLANALIRAAFGQSIRGRALAVRKFSLGDDLRRCQVLFLSATEQGRLPQILAGVAGASVLTVSDAPRFAEAGGVVQFAVDEDRVQFSVNRESAMQAHLQISAKLLTLSRVINARGVPGTK